MAVQGADAGQLRATATQLDKGASALESSAKTLHSLIGTTTQWRGPDADRFRSQWSSSSARIIATAVDALRQAADTLRRNANEQEEASKATGGGIPAQGSPGDPAAISAASLFSRVAHDDSTKDGFHTETVVGPDGRTRLIVYFEGSLQADRLTVQRNGLLVGGWVDPYLTTKLDSALSGLPEGKKTEMMFVGFSQGGMDAQNLASSGHYNVTNLVTYGSPLIQPDSAKIQTVHLQATGDNVPGMGPLGAVVNAMQSPPVIGIGQAISDLTNFNARTSALSDRIFQSDPSIAPTNIVIGGIDTGISPLGNHGDAAYQRVAADFDRSQDPRFTQVKKSMEKFGTSVPPDPI